MSRIGAEHMSGFIALGANLPSAAAGTTDTLQAAAAILHKEPDISISRMSDIWRSPAYPPGSGPDYVNAVAAITTRLTAPAVLACLHAIEADFGRDRSTGRWSARVLDLDLIDLDGQILPDTVTWRRWADMPSDRQRTDTPETLILPHPRMQDRGFVLLPMAQIAPDWRHPVTGHGIGRMMDALPGGALDGLTRMGG